MTKRIFFIIGAIGGFLFAKILERKRLERFAKLEQKEAEHKAYYADLDRRWQEELAAMQALYTLDMQGVGTDVIDLCAQHI